MKRALRNEIFSGFNNADLERARGRLIRGNTYRDLSTIMVMPTRGVIPVKVVQSLLGLMAPMNQKFTRIFVEKMEVGEAYNAAIESILANPELSKWKYVLTVEEDNVLPPDALLNLYEAIQKFDVVGALYWVKGPNGQPMIYGNPSEMPRNYIPQLPIPETVQACNGLGMGCTLFRMELFKRVPKPWFKTLQRYTPGIGGEAMTQDLYFFEQAHKVGCRVACDTRVRVGHLDSGEDTVW